jgi:hypothetical protein
MAGLVEELTAGTDPIDLGHARKHPLFIDTELQKLRQLTDIYAALKMVGQSPSGLRKTNEDYIDAALKELRTERSYMHRKTFSKKRAAALLQKHAGMVRELGYEVPEIETEVKPLVGSSDEEVQESEPEVIDPETIGEVIVARKWIEMGRNDPTFAQMLNNGLAILEKYGLNESDGIG